MIRLDVSVFPAATAAGGRALTRAALGRSHGHRLERAAGRGEVWRRQAAHDVEAGRARDGQRAVEVAGVLRGRAREIDVDRVAGDRDRGADLEQTFGRLECVDSLEAAVRKLANRGAYDAFRIGKELVHRRQDAIATAPSDELGDALLRQPVCRELRT